MSQHIADSIYQENVPVVVCIGWDRTLQYFFLAVETKDLGDDSEDGIPSTVYNTLDEVDCFMIKTLDRIKAKLVELAIKVPETMFSESENDKKDGVGNRVCYHTDKGFSENGGW